MAVNVKNKDLNLDVKNKRRFWLKKPSIILIISIAGSIIVLSFLFPEVTKDQGAQAIILIIRSTCILFLWYYLIGPFLIKKVQKYLDSKQNLHAKEVERTLQFLRPLKYIISETWSESSKYSGMLKVKHFIKLSLLKILSNEFASDEKN
jgi:hypothetical protein